MVKEKGIIFCFQNCLMFKVEMRISLSISALEPRGMPQLKVCVLPGRTDVTVTLLRLGR